ncbi:hypothetical protein FOMPIDRAFT_1124041 [Fomitopsis schrenkii]|uniref:Aspergillopepsin n=1 Tax=Fomitopsis schrenkii TaxID=2126942 RepID=S8E8A7_FOMSC|nr:hypothetical protein FOMPIDRAFT_1124041 [Fomitopsis schrenkii]
MFSLTLLTSVLLATASLARPSGLGDRVARRAAGRQSRPAQPIAHPETTTTNVSHVVYGDNWAGAVYDSYPSGTFTSVTGTFTVPTPNAPSGGSGSYSAAAWVGIDGDTCSNAILQTGVDFTIDDSGSVSYGAWYEWYPEPSYDFDSISFSAGDSVQLTVTASSTTSGTVVIENLSTGQTVTQDLTSSYELCEENAEWIVEDYEEGDSLVPFADFGTVTFTGASATTGSGSIGPGGATLFDIQQNGEILTSSSVSDSEVIIEYIG